MRARAARCWPSVLFASGFYLAAIIILAPSKAIEFPGNSITREAKSANIFIAENIAKAYVANKKYDVSVRIFFASKQVIAEAVIQAEIIISRSFMCWNNISLCQVCVQASRVDLIWESICREKTTINIVYCCWSPTIIVNMKSDGVAEINLIYRVCTCPHSTSCDFRDKVGSFGHQERLFCNVRAFYSGSRDFIRNSNGIFHLAGLNECRDQQSNGGDTQNGSCVKKTLSEKGKLPSVFGKLGVCFRFIAPFLSLFGALGVCFWGWCNIYDDRRLLGLGLLLAAFGFGNLGWWLLYPRLIPF